MPLPRPTSYKAMKVLTRAGFHGLTNTAHPAAVVGVPFCTIRTQIRGTRDTDRTGVFALNDGTVPIQWTVADDPEGHMVRIRGVDFAPMLLAWTESERSKRKGTL